MIVARAFPPRSPKWKFARRPYDPLNSEHATHVAGIAAGNYRTRAGLTRRVSGVAPKAYLGNYKVLTIPDGDFGLNGNSAEIVAGIEAAVRDGMDVINLSLGEAEIDPSRDIVARALDGAAAAGVVPVVAAGNDYEDLGAGSVTSPGSAASAITAAAESQSGPFISSFSSGGPTPLSLRMKPDVTAPGEDVLSSVPRREGLWASLSGTSMASPHVAGAAALLRQRHRGWTVEQIKSALVLTGKPVLAPGGVEADTTREGGGTIDLVRADRPLVFASPTSLAFGFVKPGAFSVRQVALSDAGGGAGALDREHDAPAARERCDSVRAAGGDGSGPARHHGNRIPGSGRGDAHRFRRPPARRGPQADPVLVPRRGAEARPGADDTAHAHRYLPGRHARAPGAGRLVPLSGRRAGTRRLADVVRSGAGIPGLGDATGIVLAPAQGQAAQHRELAIGAGISAEHG